MHLLVNEQYIDSIMHGATIKVRENQSSGSQVVPCGLTDGQTNMTKLVVAFCNFAKASNNLHCNPVRQISVSSDGENLYTFEIYL